MISKTFSIRQLSFLKTRMYWIKYLIAVFAIMCLAKTAKAQLRDEVANDFKKINATYRNPSHLSMEIEHRVYANYESNTPIESEKGVIHRSGTKLYNDNFGTITVLIDTLLIQIDKEDHTMIVSRPLDAVPEEMGSNDMDIEASLDLCDSVSFDESSSGKKIYKLWYDDSSRFRRVDLEVNSATGFIEKTVLFVTPSETEKSEGIAQGPPRVDISYSHIDTTTDNSSLFIESRYFKRSGKHLICCGKYSGYEIADMRSGGDR